MTAPLLMCHEAQRPRLWKSSDDLLPYILPSVTHNWKRYQINELKIKQISCQLITKSQEQIWRDKIVEWEEEWEEKCKQNIQKRDWTIT